MNNPKSGPPLTAATLRVKGNKLPNLSTRYTKIVHTTPRSTTKILRCLLTVISDVSLGKNPEIKSLCMIPAIQFKDADNALKKISENEHNSGYNCICLNCEINVCCISLNFE